MLPFALFILPCLLVNGQFEADTAGRIREILGPEAPPSPVFRPAAPGFAAPTVFSPSPGAFAPGPGAFMMGNLDEASVGSADSLIPGSVSSPEMLRFSPTASIRITPSKAEPPPIEESLDFPAHQWNKMTVLFRTGSNGKSLQSLNDQFARVLSTWIRTTKGRMGGRPFTATTPTPTEASGSVLPPSTTTTYPPPFDNFSPVGPPPPARPTPPPTEFVDRETLLTTKPPKTGVFDPRMPTIVEGWPLGGEFIERNPLIDEDDGQYPPPATFEEMLRICPMYPETSTMFVHQIVKRDYSASFETRVQCRCGDGSHASFYARKSKPLLTDIGPSLDPSFLKSDVIVGRFGCAFPGNICVRTENGIRLRSMDWGAQVYPAVGSGGGWANSYILLMENGTRLEDADSGKVYLGRTQFDGERRKSRLEHSYLRIKSITCDGCTHELTCQR